MKKTVKNLTLSAMFLALCMILPFITGGVPRIGNAISPMHIPVLICGFVCGWQYGAAVGFMGMNMAGGADTSSLFKMAQEKKGKEESGDFWTCSCGAKNKGKFCTECGAQRRTLSSWVCSCGAVNTGKFCSECGKKRPEAKKCPSCGWSAKEGENPKFCPECGQKLE